jgi:hypothetical protein
MFNNLFNNHQLKITHPQKQNQLKPISFLLQEETTKTDLPDTDNNKDLPATDNKDLLDTDNNKDLPVTVEETEVQIHQLVVLAILSLDSVLALEVFTLLS